MVKEPEGDQYGNQSDIIERQHPADGQCPAQSAETGRKGMVDQGNIQVQEEKKQQLQAKQVAHADEAVFKEERFDAKEKGHNGYSGDGGKKRKKLKGDGRVVAKSGGGFDMKI